MLTQQHEHDLHHLSTSVLSNPGATDPLLRQNIATYTEQLSDPSLPPTAQVPPELISYITKVATHAYRTTDKDIAYLKSLGYSEDAIFEITLSISLGAAMTRFMYATAILEGETHATESH